MDDHLTWLFSAPGTSGHLHNQLGHALTGAEICRKQPAISIENGHQRHAREMVAFGEHLCADQNARLTFLHGVEQGVHGFFTRGAVAVDAQHRYIREEDFQAFFGALGARADRAQVDVIAFRAVARLALDMPAVVAT